MLKAFLFALIATLPAAQADDHGSNWAYEGEMGPEHWAELEGSACNGEQQSPVNIIRTDADPAHSNAWPMALHYSPETMIYQAVNNGHSIQFEFAEGDELTFRGERFTLRQLHFHEPSEHTLNGVRYPIEMHMVHFSEKLQQFVVLAVLGYEGKPSPGYDQLESVLPLAPGKRKEVNKAFDLEKILPSRLTPRFHYTGSLTTPPCTEGVDWVVFEAPFMLSEPQVELLKRNLPRNNYRDVQPLNGRKVSLVVH